MRKNFKCLHCEKNTDIQGIFKIKYKDIIKGWNFDHYDGKEAWDLMKLQEGKKKSNNFVLETKNDGILLKIKKKDIKNDGLLSKKTHNFKKNTQFVYKSLFNEIERESSYSTANFFSSETKNDRNFENLITLDKNYIIPTLIKKMHQHLKEKEYNNLMKNPGFLAKIALVCEECYLLIIGSSHSNESLKQITKKHLINQHIFVGKGKLNPEMLIHRYEVKFLLKK